MPTTYREGQVIQHDGATPPEPTPVEVPVVPSEPVEPDEADEPKPAQRPAGKPVKPAKKGHR